MFVKSVLFANHIMKNNSPEFRTPPLADRLLRGAIWTVAMRWGVRLLGLTSMLVLVRLLEPEDFGILAMAMAVIALVDMLTDFGVAAALIRNKNAGRVQFDTAWTVRQMQFLVVAGTVALCAPMAAAYYDDPRITEVLRVLAVVFAIRSFENIGIINFQRELMFHRDFIMQVSVKSASVITTLVLAFWLRNYWALILGMVAESILSVGFSYWMCPYRPSWTLAAWRELWGFSQWVLSQGFARYIYERSDVLFLGRLTSADNVGYYSVSNEIAALPATEISLPISRAVFPGFAQIVDEPKRLKTAYLHTLNAVATVTIPIGIGMAAVAEEFVQLVLGEKWLPAISLLQVFAVFATFGAINSISGNLLVVLGYIRHITLIMWLQAALLVVAIVPVFGAASLVGVAMLRASLSLLGLSLVLHSVVRVSRVRLLDLARALVRPAVAAAAMICCLFLTNTVITIGTTPTISQLTISLVVNVLAASVVYMGTLITIWHIAGRPDGIESLVISKLSRSRKVAGG